MFNRESSKSRKSFNKLRRKLSQPACTSRYLKVNLENRSPPNIKNRRS